MLSESEFLSLKKEVKYKLYSTLYSEKEELSKKLEEKDKFISELFAVLQEKVTPTDAKSKNNGNMLTQSTSQVLLVEIL